MSPTEQATLERILGKAGRGERLSAADKHQLRTIVARHFPKAADYQWRNVVRLALALVGPIGPDAGLA